MEALKAFIGNSIRAGLIVYGLLLFLFPVGWLILLGTLIKKPSMDKRSIEAKILGAELEL
ncbi:MAG: hypothetical protein PHD41_01640 [Methanosarcinaceae archaeon]|nr:hypothetical protein [Methanosarcinaceae archaeon]MDD4332465.1 hypothetical protein [Methanosarcinaceae archaeon]MDD4748860.1 hypothetical protein [Methanosarcinaceae archaeon]